MPRLLLAPALAAVAAAALAAPAPAAAVAHHCTTATTFDLYAIPSGYENDTKDVFVPGLPRRARNVAVRFVRAVDGRPVGSRAFPLQTWTARVRGFRRDGLLWIQVTLSGDGYGMPAARSSRWRAVVSYDC